MLDRIRGRAERGVSAGLPPQMGALAQGMVLGADEEIPAAMSDDFKASGLADVLAVSGQNVAWPAALAWPVLAAAGVGRRGRLVGVAIRESPATCPSREPGRRSCGPGRAASRPPRRVPG